MNVAFFKVFHKIKPIIIKKEREFMSKKLLAILSVFALVTLVTACRGVDDPEGVELSQTEVEVEYGDSVTVTAEVEPEDAEQGIVWSSADESVATVEDGEITGVSLGSTTVRAAAEADEDVYAEVAVTVVYEGNLLITIEDEDPLAIPGGEGYTLDVGLTPEDEGVDLSDLISGDIIEFLSFASSDEEVLTVSADGVITPVSLGTATVTVSSDEASGEATISVEIVEPDEGSVGVTLDGDATMDEEAVEVEQYLDFDLMFTVEPAPFIVYEDITVTVGDESVLAMTEDEGVYSFDALTKGSTTITISVDSDLVSDLILDVDVVALVPHITVPDVFAVQEGETDQILPAILPAEYLENFDELDLEFISSDEDAFTVDADGNITGVLDGEEATLTINDVSNHPEDEATAASVEVTILVVDTLPASGWHDYLFAAPELRETLFAHAERYLLETQYAGIPMYANAGYNLYDERIDLPVDAYVPVMGFGTAQATILQDDSNVIMDDDNPGNEGDYTFRQAVTSDPGQLNHWNYEDSITADILTLMLDSLYYFDFNAAMDGYEVLPSMASDDPRIPAEAESEVRAGLEISRTWQIDLRDDLEWYFHPDFDAEGLSTTIDAHDFVDTYEIAMEEGWFRATSGGGDFTSAPQEIVNAQAFIDGDDEVDFEDVGIKALDDYTLEFNFVENMSDWTVKYWLSSFVTSPIHVEMYEQLGDDYATDAETFPAHGRNYLEFYQPDQVYRLRENPNFHAPDRQPFTGWNFLVIADAAQRFEQFTNGRLDSTGVPAAEYENYQDDPRIEFVPGATTFRMNVNSLGTVERQEEQHPGSTFVPEPILAHPDMKLAMYFATDRNTITDEVMVTNTPQDTYYTEAYLVSPATGVPFREGPWGDSVLSGDEFTNGYVYDDRAIDFTQSYDADYATILFEGVVADLVADGTYDAGTADDPNIIELQFTYQSGSEALDAFAQFLDQAYAEILYDDTHHIGIELDLDPMPFPDNYFERIIIGNTDLGMGGIAGGTLDAANFLFQYTEDNQGGFTLDWGIDTTTPNVVVTYDEYDEDGNVIEGETKEELWSFNALVAALNGPVYLQGGVPATPPAEEELE